MKLHIENVPAFAYRASAFLLAIITIGLLAAPLPLKAQYYDYNSLTSIIKTYRNEKTYSAANSFLLDSILAGMDYFDGGPYGALPKRLVGGLAASKVTAEMKGASDAHEGALIGLLWVTQEAKVPAQLTDVGLHKAVGRDGSALKKSIAKLWERPALDDALIESLEGFPPEEAAVLADVVSQTWFGSQTAKVYENTYTTWAAQSLWQVYRDARFVELAKRSTVVKLLHDNYYLSIPTETYANFFYSHDPTIVIALDPVVWSNSDVPALQRLVSNPYYGAMAQQELTNLGL
jgi:hypothetical protein